MFQFPSHSCSWLSTIPNWKTTVVYLAPKMFFNILTGATMKKFMAKSQPPRQWRETWPRAPGSPYVSFNRAFQPSIFRACWFSGMLRNIVPSFTPKFKQLVFLREKKNLAGERKTRWTLLLCFFGMSAGYFAMLSPLLDLPAPLHSPVRPNPSGLDYGVTRRNWPQSA